MVIGGVFWKILQDCFLSSIKHKLVTGDIPIGENILKICEIMKSAAIIGGDFWKILQDCFL
jgi:hypothetical protein